VDTAIVDEQPDEHTWRLDGYRVTQLLVDASSFRFQSWALDGAVEIRCGAPFTFRDVDGREVAIDPELPERLAPLLTLTGRGLATVRVRRSGELMMQFGDGSAIVVPPHERYEAWEIRGSGVLEKLSYLCNIGGGSPWG
jgi:hypothetical protein